MERADREEITRLLNELPDATSSSRDRAWEILYPEVLRIARGQRRRWQGEWTLETRALSNEVFIKLFGGGSRDFTDRKHFFRLTARVIRQVLVNYAEERRAAKRGGGADEVTIDEGHGLRLTDGEADQVCDLHQALERFASVDPRAAEIVELKFFVGLTHDEIAETLGISRPTVIRDWAAARAWLWREMGEVPGGGSGE